MHEDTLEPFWESSEEAEHPEVKEGLRAGCETETGLVCDLEPSLPPHVPCGDREVGDREPVHEVEGGVGEDSSYGSDVRHVVDPACLRELLVKAPEGTCENGGDDRRNRGLRPPLDLLQLVEVNVVRPGEELLTRVLVSHEAVASDIRPIPEGLHHGRRPEENGSGVVGQHLPFWNWKTFQRVHSIRNLTACHAETVQKQPGPSIT